MTDPRKEYGTEPLPLEEFPPFAECADCGGDIRIVVWGEGIDSEVQCVDCDNSTGYR